MKFVKVTGNNIMRKTAPKNKGMQGFASPKYDPASKHAAQSKGGSRRVKKGFAMMSPEKILAFAQKGGRGRAGKRV